MKNNGQQIYVRSQSDPDSHSTIYTGTGNGSMYLEFYTPDKQYLEAVRVKDLHTDDWKYDLLHPSIRTYLQEIQKPYHIRNNAYISAYESTCPDNVIKVRSKYPEYFI
jgi:hypothetical protein